MNRNTSKRDLAMVFGMAAVVFAIAGCDAVSATAVGRDPRTAESRSEPGPDLAEQILPSWYEGEQPVLRVRMDSTRNRLWVLTRNGVGLYDVTVHRKLAQVPLPDWVWVRERYAGAPDLALGPEGEAVVSSNVVPALWRIDPASFVATRHEPALDEDEGKDIGFSALVYSPGQGTFFAVSASHGSLWRIDPLFRRAQRVALSAPIPKAYALAVGSRAPSQRASRFVALCVRSDREDRTINLAPDQRSGYVSTVPCTMASGVARGAD